MSTEPTIEGVTEMAEEILDTSAISTLSVEDFAKYFAATARSTHRREDTLFHFASAHDRADVIEKLVKDGADVDVATTRGETALHAASRRGCANAMQTLLEYGTDINIVCKSGKTPLNYEACAGFEKSFAQLFRLHAIKMQAANRRVSEENLRIIGDNGETSFLRYDCENEIERMREETIFGNVSYYDILTEDANKLATYARAESARYLKSDRYEHKFPIYRGWIDNNLGKGRRRNKLLELAADSLNLSIGYKLPNDLTVEICRYLSNDELRNLITANEGKET